MRMGNMRFPNRSGALFVSRGVSVWSSQILAGIQKTVLDTCIKTVDSGSSGLLLIGSHR